MLRLFFTRMAGIQIDVAEISTSVFLQESVECRWYQGIRRRKTERRVFWVPKTRYKAWHDKTHKMAPGTNSKQCARGVYARLLLRER